jgi:hypothetical protein
VGAAVGSAVGSSVGEGVGNCHPQPRPCQVPRPVSPTANQVHPRYAPP